MGVELWSREKISHVINMPKTRVGLLFFLFLIILIFFVFWFKTPSYVLLLDKLNSTELNEVTSYLTQRGVHYQIEAEKGAILVDKSDLREARFKIAEEGLPRRNGRGYEILKGAQAFGISQFMETARLKYALETEISRTLAQLDAIKSARVHLALPKQSSFIRNEIKPTASIFIEVKEGESFDDDLVNSIKMLVSGSVAGLSKKNITLVNQKGLLTSGKGTLSRTPLVRAPTKASLSIKEKRQEQSTTALIAKKNSLQPFVFIDLVRFVSLGLLLYFIFDLTSYKLKKRLLVSTHSLNVKEESAFKEHLAALEPVAFEGSSGEKINEIKEIVNSDPKSVAKIVRNWVEGDD